MVDVDNMAYLIHQAQNAGSKVILVGDPDQLKPIRKGEIFRGIASLTGFIELENILRQEDKGDRQASLNLAKGNIDEALAHYIQKNAVIHMETPEAAMNQLIDDWQKENTSQPLKESILLAYTRKAVSQLPQRRRKFHSYRRTFFHS